MRAARYERTGPAEDVIELTEIDTPEPGPRGARARRVLGREPDGLEVARRRDKWSERRFPDPEPGRLRHDRRSRRWCGPRARRRARLDLLRGLAASVGHGGRVQRRPGRVRRAAAGQRKL